MAKFCTSCGTSLNDAAKFCNSCGTQQTQQTQQAQQPQSQATLSQPAPLYQQPLQQPVMTQKQQTLYNAPGALNRPDCPWQVTVEGDAIVARWKWMDATFFAPHEVTNETKDYTFTVFLSDKGTWREVDKTEEKTSGAKMSGGKMSFGSSSSSFIGKTNQKSFSFGTGQNNQTGETGVIGFKFNTTDVKQPIRDYLISCGWKKSGLFG